MLIPILKISKRDSSPKIQALPPCATGFDAGKSLYAAITVCEQCGWEIEWADIYPLTRPQHEVDGAAVERILAVMECGECN